jgi:hypothetical protein
MTVSWIFSTMISNRISSTKCLLFDDMNNSNDTEVREASDAEKDKIKQQGLTYPSKTHTGKLYIAVSN